jgi:hypothetical protein
LWYPDQEGFIFLLSGVGVGGQHLVNELGGGLALTVERAGDAAAGVDEQAEAEGEVALAGEALDGLRAAILSEGEVADLEAGDERAVLVADGDGQDDLAGLDLERRFRLGRCVIGLGLLRAGGRRQEQRGEDEEDGGRVWHESQGEFTFVQKKREDGFVRISILALGIRALV